MRRKSASVFLDPFLREQITVPAVIVFEIFGDSLFALDSCLE